ncbi:MAG: TonB family protein [Calditrichia bacterium]
MKRNYIITILSLIILLAYRQPLQGQNYFSGPITEDTRWSGSVYLDGDVIVKPGALLEIDRGTRIIVKPNSDSRKSGADPERTEIIVEGRLQAIGGDITGSIIFTSEESSPQMNDWYGIVDKNRKEASEFRHVVVEYAYKGITCYGSSPQIENSEIRFNHHSGVSCEVRAAPLIDKCVIVGNGFAGINCVLGSQPQVSQTIISQNTHGVVIFSKSQPDLGRYPVRASASSGENRINNNFDYDIYNQSGETVYAQNNFWQSERYSEIDKSVYDRQENSRSGEVITRPTFTAARRRSLPVAAVPPPDSVKEKTVDSTAVAVLQNVPVITSRQPEETMSRLKPDTVQEKLPEKAEQSNPETLLVQKEKPPETPPEIEPVIPREPLLEAFLDAGRREYLQRKKPEYPRIYQQTGTEGNVLVEVQVDRKGKIEDYHILHSDGKLFTEAVQEALKAFRYKPGTYQGRPVKFKLVERFQFRKGK